MAKVETNGIELEYLVSGQAGAEPILVIGGLGIQLNQGMGEFIPALVENGFKVITFDNRDVGLSTKHDEWGLADIKTAFQQARAGKPVTAPYNLEDMAKDTAGLLDALGVSTAHVLGSSNGGAIAQILALNFPEKVRTLTCVMATSGRRGLPRASEAATAWLNKPANPEGTREGAALAAVEKARIIGSAVYPKSEAVIRQEAIYYYERAFYPAGNGRHLLASIASGDSRVARLGDITAPTLVLHGRDDPLIPYQCGEDIKKSIPNAKFLLFDGMAHEYSAALIPDLVNAITKHVRSYPV